MLSRHDTRAGRGPASADGGLAGVDVWLESQVRKALIYVRWDDKVMESAAESARRRHNAIARSMPAESVGGAED